MISVNITITSIDELIEVSEKLERFNINIFFKGSYDQPSRTCNIQRVIRREEIMNIFLTNPDKYFDIKKIHRLLMYRKIKCILKTVYRDLFILTQEDKITKEKLPIISGGFKNVYKYKNQ
jgi:predicted alpha-1,6-mannanase (GH76 family)